MNDAPGPQDFLRAGGVLVHPVAAGAAVAYPVVAAGACFESGAVRPKGGPPCVRCV
ncbi:hypothetical protein ACE1SV_28910 [Streptomyces sennicomposti]